MSDQAEIISSSEASFTSEEAAHTGEVVVEPSQIQYPAQAVKRTGLAAIVSNVLTFLGVLSAIITAAHEELSQITITEGAPILVSVTVLATAVTAALTRIMAIPAVDEWLRKLGFGAEPK